MKFGFYIIPLGFASHRRVTLVACCYILHFASSGKEQLESQLIVIVTHDRLARPVHELLGYVSVVNMHRCEHAVE